MTTKRRSRVAKPAKVEPRIKSATAKLGPYSVNSQQFFLLEANWSEQERAEFVNAAKQELLAKHGPDQMIAKAREEVEAVMRQATMAPIDGVEDGDARTVLAFMASQVLERARELEGWPEIEREMIFKAISFGLAWGDLHGAIVAWQQTKGGRRERADTKVRRAKLRAFIQERGWPPEKGKFGKTNPARTKYFQAFKRASGLEFQVDTFNRDVKALLKDAQRSA